MQQDKKDTKEKRPTIESLKQPVVPLYAFQKQEYESGSSSSNLNEKNQKSEIRVLAKPGLDTLVKVE